MSATAAFHRTPPSLATADAPLQHRSSTVLPPRTALPVAQRRRTLPLLSDRSHHLRCPFRTATPLLPVTERHRSSQHRRRLSLSNEHHHPSFTPKTSSPPSPFPMKPRTAARFISEKPKPRR